MESGLGPDVIAICDFFPFTSPSPLVISDSSLAHDEYTIQYLGVCLGVELLLWDEDFQLSSRAAYPSV